MLTVFILAAANTGTGAEVPEPPPLAPLPSANDVLDQVVARLPAEPLQINGELRADPRDGKTGRRCQVQLFLQYGANPPQARYTLMDSFGEDLEQLTVIRQEGKPVSLHYAKGYPLADAVLVDPRQPLQGTDVTWADLSLSFLWWRPGKLTGVEKVLERECLVIEVPSPAAEKSPYASARLWIDKQYLMLMRAEGLDPAGKPLRRIAVKSIKKIDDEWMVKDLDVTSLPSNLRTSLRINFLDKPDTETPAR
jgi:hypothetical protein